MNTYMIIFCVALIAMMIISYKYIFHNVNTEEDKIE